MTQPSPVHIRDPQLLASLDEALAGNPREFFEQLSRKSGLPGPRPNFSLALAVAEQIAAQGKQGNALTRELCGMDETRAPADTSREILPVVGALTLAARYKANIDSKRALAALHTMADDERRLVREAVVLALRHIAKASDESFFETLSPWMDGYLQSVAVLDTLSDRHVLERMTKSEPILARLDDAFRLIEEAPRAHRRMQGHRVLVRVLGEAPAAVMVKFPDEIAAFLTERATTKSPDIRASVEKAIDRARKAGLREGRVEGALEALDESAPPRRDPLTDVGPTRGRGRRRRRK